MRLSQFASWVYYSLLRLLVKSKEAFYVVCVPVVLVLLFSDLVFVPVVAPSVSDSPCAFLLELLEGVLICRCSSSRSL